MRSVLVSHPHAAAVAIAVARAFDRTERLSMFVTGIAAAEGSRRAAVLHRAAGLWPQAANRIIDGIVPTRLRTLSALELASRGIAMLGPQSSRPRRTYNALFRFHDQTVATLGWPRSVDCVYAYEDAALATFARASRGTAWKVLDIPAVHARSQERIWREEMERWPSAMRCGLVTEPRRKALRKATEIELADVLCVASNHARQTLDDAGVRKQTVVVPYGFPVGRFTPAVGVRSSPFTVVSVGVHDLRKGTPYLLEAWRKAGLQDARLRIVGPMRLEANFLSGYSMEWEHVRHVARKDMAQVYRQADLLVFPTLGDGFGLVIQEAMSCGTPVLTTTCSGGPECLDDGVEGWLVPPRDVDALVDRLRWAAANRDQLATMGSAARRRAELYGEREAGEALIRELERVLGNASSCG